MPADSEEPLRITVMSSSFTDPDFLEKREKIDLDSNRDQRVLFVRTLDQNANKAGAQLTTIVPKISAKLVVLH
jgi:hypothetical protein